MSSLRGTPESESLTAEAIASALLSLRVATIGIVKSYDATTQTADVMPAIRRPIETDEGEILQEADSVVPNALVAHWGSAALNVVHTLAAGDAVLLVYLDYSPLLWRKRGQVSDTPDTHAHRYPVAIPLMRPRGGPSADTGESIGEPGGTRVHFEAGVARVGPATDPAADFVAHAAKTDARLAALEAFMASHTHPYVDTPVGAAVTSPAAGFVAGNGGASVAASKLKTG